MKRQRFRLVHDNCRRCGKGVVTGNRSLYRGTEAIKAQYGSICSDCTTPEERDAMLRAMGQRIAGALAR